MGSRKTIVVHTRLAGHMARVEAARTSQNGFQIMTKTEGRALIDALDEAKRRLEAARQNEALSADRAAAREVRKELSAFREHGQSLDVALAAIALHGRELQATLIRMHQLGVNFPSGAQLDALGGRALMAACSQTPWRRRFDAVPPRERYRFAELVEGWAATVERGIAQRLGEQKDNTDAAA